MSILSGFRLWLPATFARSGYFRRDCGMDARVVEIGVVIPPAVIRPFGDLTGSQLGRLFLPCTEALLQIGRMNAAIKNLSTQTDQTIRVGDTKWFLFHPPSFPKRALMASAGSTGAGTGTVSGGTLIWGSLRRVFPSNCGSHSRSASGISATMSRLCLSDSTADVSGSIATAQKASSGSPFRAASAAKPCTVKLDWFIAARCGGSAPTVNGCRPSLSA